MLKLSTLVLLLVAWGLGGPGWASADDGRPNLIQEDADLDPGIPTLVEVVGHDFGVDISDHAQTVRYIEALAEAAPERTKLVRYGESYEGKALYYLVITSPTNLERLEDIRERSVALARGELDEGAEANLPAVLWISCSVHGDETSSTDAALLTAYHVLADRRDVTKARLEEVVLILDPLQNPDGRDRFIKAHREFRGVFPDDAPLAAERTQRWARGRFNHYLFDMNRDWFAQTQRESRAKVAAYLDWSPQVFVDAHEMGSNSTYYFANPAAPVHPLITPSQIEWTDKLTRRQAAAFDENGFAYTTGELFDAFFPGYGSTWPLFHSGVGILWEQAGARGLKVKRDDDLILTYADGVEHHYVSGLAYLDLVAEQRESLLDATRSQVEDAIRLGEEGPVAAYLLQNDGDRTRLEALVDKLQDNGVLVEKVVGDNDGDVEESEGGSDDARSRFLVRVAQPNGRLVRALFDEENPMDEAFITRQLERRAERKSNEIYDVTAWNLADLYGVEAIAIESADALSGFETDEQGGQFKISVVPNPDPKVGYLVRGDDSAVVPSLADWLRAGLRVRVFDQPSTFNGLEYPRGSLLLRVNENPESLDESVLRAVRAHGVDVVGLNSALADDGAQLGGPYVTYVEPPKIAMLVNRPTSTNVGATWYLFDQVWKYPTTRLDAAYLGGLDLDEYNVLIMPSGSYGGSNGPSDAVTQRIKRWIEEGGTLIAVGGALRWACSEKVGLLETEPKTLPVDEGDEDEAEGGNEGSSDGDQTEPLPNIPGAIFDVAIETDHWVTFGMPEESRLLVLGNLAVDPLPVRRGVNLVTYKPTGENPQGEPEFPSSLRSGFLWPELDPVLNESPIVLAQPRGAGHVVGFVTDPNFRAWSPHFGRLFWNAVMFGPGH